MLKIALPPIAILGVLATLAMLNGRAIADPVDPPGHPRPVLFDFDGDGVTDRLAASVGFSQEQPVCSIVQVYSGAFSQFRFALIGAEPNDFFGYALSSAGDVNDDGFEDIIIGAPRNSGGGLNAGAVYMFSGVDGSLLYTLNGLPGEFLGTAVAGAGDINGDSTPDVLVTGFDSSDPFNVTGLVWALSGDDGSPIRMFSPDQPDESFGHSLLGLGDLNGNGFDDVMIVSSGALNANGLHGKAYIFAGAASGPVPDTVYAVAASSVIANNDAGVAIFGHLVTLGMDVDGDGKREVVIASRPSDTTVDQYYLAAVDTVTKNTLVANPNFQMIHPGDATGDQQTDLDDLNVTIVNFGGSTDLPTYFDGDINGDGVIDADDLNPVLDAFGTKSDLQLLAGSVGVSVAQLGRYSIGIEDDDAGTVAYQSAGSADPLRIQTLSGSPLGLVCAKNRRPGRPYVDPDSTPGPDRDRCPGDEGFTPPDDSPFGDRDGDGIPNREDCDEPEYQGDPATDCGCQDSDNDGTKNQNDCDSQCPHPYYDPELDSDHDGIENIDDCDSPVFIHCGVGDLDGDGIVDVDNCECHDDDHDGRKNQIDCDSSCPHELYSRAGDQDGDGLLNYLDGDWLCFEGNPASTDSDGDGIVDSQDCDSRHFSADPCLCTPDPNDCDPGPYTPGYPPEPPPAPDSWSGIPSNTDIDPTPSSCCPNPITHPLTTFAFTWADYRGRLVQAQSGQFNDNAFPEFIGSVSLSGECEYYLHYGGWIEETGDLFILPRIGQETFTLWTFSEFTWNWSACQRWPTTTVVAGLRPVDDRGSLIGENLYDPSPTIGSDGKYHAFFENFESSGAGVVIPVNDNDSDYNDVPDLEQESIGFYDLDLCPILIGAGPVELFDESGNVTATGTYQFTYPSDRIRLWADPKKTQQVPATGGIADLPSNILWIEGLEVSVEPGDVVLGFEYTIGGIQVSQDMHITVYKLHLADLNGQTRPVAQMVGGADLDDIDDVVVSGGDLSSMEQSIQAYGENSPFIVDGITADGASVCLIVTEPSFIWGPSVQIELAKPSHYYADLGGDESAGALWLYKPEFDSSFGGQVLRMPPLPIDDALGSDPALSAQTDFEDGKAVLVAPPSLPLSQTEPQSFPIDDGAGRLVGLTIRSDGGVWPQVRTIRLRRAPLLVVHGLFSAPITWNNLVWSKANFGTDVVLMDYQASHGDGYDKNWDNLDDAIDDLRQRQRSGDVDGSRYSIARIDLVGHSMGGVLARLHASDLATTGQVEIDRDASWYTDVVGSNYWPIDLRRNQTMEYWYLNASNNWAGDYRRFVSIASPFQGSGIATVGRKWFEAQVDEQLVGDLAAAARNRTLGSRMQMGLTTFPKYSQVPHATIDLIPGSEMDDAIDNANFPTGRRRVRWHAIVGIANHEYDPESIRRYAQGFIYNVADGVAQGFGWEGIVEIDPMNSDLVVHKDSQSLGQLNDATIMVDMVHSNGQNNTDIANFYGIEGLVSETQSESIANRVRDLLRVLDLSTTDWDAVLDP
ncbi:MAG: alpha/beta fold hydrolase [Phycisphaeraceae bacterium]|nr:alpha/beta fold hydrolase [Phycisphaerales bacterium]MCB9842338.1 alpha/beta fold hydrolase [Phycisphaeraceae bacterium]